jgi:hypothetical protein
MKVYQLAALAAVGFQCLAGSAMAHHSFSMFDRGKTDTLTGEVKELELINPHGWLKVMAPDLKGHPVEWSLEMGGAGQLQRSGWSATAVHPGDKVVVKLHPLRDGSYGGQLVSVTLPDGKVLGQGGFGPRQD